MEIKDCGECNELSGYCFDVGCKMQKDKTEKTEKKPISLDEKRAAKEKKVAKEKEREVIRRIVKAAERLPF